MVHPYKLQPHETINTFLSSPAYKIYTQFIQDLSLSVRGKTHDKNEPVPKNHLEIVDILTELDGIISECPLRERTLGRFGNLAFRDWFQKMADKADGYILRMSNDFEPDVVSLLLNYFLDSFGNHTRVDYGSGHEGAFGFFLCSLHLLGFFKKEEMRFTVFVVFKRYLDLVRNIQKTFSLEPAGSHGSWGLDDFQFLPYIFGASQLIGPKSDFHPRDILNKEICNKHKDNYMFFGCIDFIHQIKKGPFSEHSSVLYSASQATSWTKVLQGLDRMYVTEFLSKYPIVQHFWFGDLMPLHDEPKT